MADHGLDVLARQHWVYGATYWLLLHGEALSGIFVTLAGLAVLVLLAYLWLLNGAKALTAVLVWRHFKTLWGWSPRRRPGGAGGRRTRFRRPVAGSAHSTLYREVMQSQGWREKREQALRRDGYRCQTPGCQEQARDVHHLTYDRLGHERLSDLVSLCPRCHARKHRRRRSYI